MVFYFVQRGETLYAIAKRYQTTVHAIVAANRLDDPNAICAGQALIIPRPGEVPSPPPGGVVHLVRTGETIFHLARKFGSSPHEILRANQIAHPEFILPGQQLVIPECAESPADWPMLGRNPARTGAGPVPLKGLPSEGWSYTPRRSLGAQPSAPVVRYDRVIAALGDGHYYCFDRRTGRVKWRVPVVGSDAIGQLDGYGLPTPAVADGLVYICGVSGGIMAVDAYTGQTVWKVSTDGIITSSPVTTEGVVYFGSWDRHVYAFEVKTGALAWQSHVGARVTQPIAVGDRQVFAVTDGGELWALDADTGEVSWRTPIDTNQPPCLAEVVLLVGDHALDPKTGQVLWEVEAGGTTPVANLDQVVYAGGVVDLFTGDLRESYYVGNFSGSASAAASHPDPAACKDSQSQPDATSERCGHSEEGPTVVPSPHPAFESLTLSGGLLLGVRSDRALIARDVSSGQTVWALHLNAPARQPLAVSDGQLFVCLSNGSIRSYQCKTL